MARRRMAAGALIAAATIAAGGLTAVALGAKSTSRSLQAVQAVAFNKKALRAPQGTVTIVMRNRTALPHNVALRGGGLKRPLRGRVVLGGGVSRVSARLRPGRYVFYCSVRGHEGAGMRGTLTVTR